MRPNTHGPLVGSGSIAPMALAALAISIFSELAVNEGAVVSRRVTRAGNRKTATLAISLNRHCFFLRPTRKILRFEPLRARRVPATIVGPSTGDSFKAPGGQTFLRGSFNNFAFPDVLRRARHGHHGNSSKKRDHCGSGHHFDASWYVVLTSDGLGTGSVRENER